jgi:hypothetical protein
VAGKIDVPAGGGVRFTLPVSASSDVSSKAVYISMPNGEILYRATIVANSAVTYTYSGDATGLVTPLLTQFKGPPPAGQLVGYFRGHLFSAAGDLLYPSDPFSYELFDLRRFVQLDGRITLFAPFEDTGRAEQGRNSGVFIGTDRSCGVLVGSDPERFEYVAKADYGAVLGALDYVDGDLYGDRTTGAKNIPMWMTTDGICVGMPGMEIKNLTRGRYNVTIGGKGAALFQAGPDTFTVVANL